MATPGALRTLFRQMDAELTEPLEIYVAGGANLLSQGVPRPATEDVDVIFPLDLPEHVLKVVERLAAKHRLTQQWMNTKPAFQFAYLSRGWKKRALLFFKGRRLRVFMLGRRDMLGLKLAAAVERTIDQKDLLAMNPVDKEWEAARKWARNYPANPGWKQLVDSVVEKLKRQQHDG